MGKEHIMANTILYYAGKKYHQPINGNNYIKTFNWSKETYYLDRCAAELLCRTYLTNGKFYMITTKTLSIEPQVLQDYLNTFTNNDIQQNFNNLFIELKEYLHTHCDSVLITIEEARPIDIYQQHQIANNESERHLFVRRLFEILQIIHDNNLVHRDIKIDNLMYVTRNNRETLVLNDWDASFILQNEFPEGLRDVLPLLTLIYAAPEQISRENKQIGRHTDIWQAGMVAYYLYNNCHFPPSYQKIDFERNNNTKEKQKIREDMNGIFSDLREYNRTFERPANGDENIQNTILSALCIDPNNRKTANEIIIMIDRCDQNMPVEAVSDSITPEEWQRIEREKQENERRRKADQKEKIRPIIFLTFCAFIAWGVIYVFNIKNDRTGGQASQPSAIAAAPTSTESAVQTEQTIPPEETVYITETVPSSEPITENIESTIGIDIESLDFTYTKWVENYRLGDGYYTGGFDENNHVQGKNCMYIKDDGEEYIGNYYHGFMCDDDCYYKFSNGNEYWGAIRDSEKHGEGTFKKVNTDDGGCVGTYEGVFKNDLFDGKGTFTYDNGNVFLGTFNQYDLWNGIVTDSDGKVIKEIVNGKPKD